MIAFSVLPSRSYPIQATEIVNDVCFRSSPPGGSVADNLRGNYIRLMMNCQFIKEEIA